MINEKGLQSVSFGTATRLAWAAGFRFLKDICVVHGDGRDITTAGAAGHTSVTVNCKQLMLCTQ